MFACTMLEARQSREKDMQVAIDDTHYDASEEESLFEMEMDREIGGAIPLENPQPILFNSAGSQTRDQQRSVSEPKPTRKPWPGKLALRPRPVLTGEATSDDENEGEDGARKKSGKAKVVRRHASWPRLPLKPKAHDSGVQGLESSDSDGSDGGFNLKRTRVRKRKGEELQDFLTGDEESVMFRGIAEADSNEERWRQIVLEEHMDRIFNTLPKLPSEQEIGQIKVENDEVVRESFESDDWGIRARRQKGGWKEEMLMILRFFGCMGRRKGEEE